MICDLCLSNECNECNHSHIHAHTSFTALSFISFVTPTPPLIALFFLSPPFHPDSNSTRKLFDPQFTSPSHGSPSNLSHSAMFFTHNSLLIVTQGLQRPLPGITQTTIGLFAAPPLYQSTSIRRQMKAIFPLRLLLRRLLRLSKKGTSGP